MVGLIGNLECLLLYCILLVALFVPILSVVLAPDWGRRNSKGDYPGCAMYSCAF